VQFLKSSVRLKQYETSPIDVSQVVVPRLNTSHENLNIKYGLVVYIIIHKILKNELHFVRIFSHDRVTTDGVRIWNWIY
jgi:hypothetical protein